MRALALNAYGARRYPCVAPIPGYCTGSSAQRPCKPTATTQCRRTHSGAEQATRVTSADTLLKPYSRPVSLSCLWCCARCSPSCTLIPIHCRPTWLPRHMAGQTLSSCLSRLYWLCWWRYVMVLLVRGVVGSFIRLARVPVKRGKLHVRMRL